MLRIHTASARTGGLRTLTALALASAATLPGAAFPQSGPSLTAAPSAAIEVDGRLDEAAWTTVEAVTEFRQFEPTEGAPSSQPTEVRVLYGPGSLYVGAILHDSDPGEIERTLGRRDEFNRADWFIVSIDTYLDRRTAHAFGVNAAGVQFDAVQGGGGGGPGGGGGGGGGEGEAEGLPRRGWIRRGTRSGPPRLP